MEDVGYRNIGLFVVGMMYIHIYTWLIATLDMGALCSFVLACICVRI